MSTVTKTLAGTDLAIYLEDVMIGCATEVSISMEVEMTAATCKASNGWAENTPSVKSWSASASGVVKYYATADAAANKGVVDFRAYFKAGTKLTLKYSTEVTGDTFEEGDAYISSIEETAGDGNATYSISFTGTGPLTTQTVAA